MHKHDITFQIIKEIVCNDIVYIATSEMIVVKWTLNSTLYTATSAAGRRGEVDIEQYAIHCY